MLNKTRFRILSFLWVWVLVWGIAIPARSTTKTKLIGVALLTSQHQFFRELEGAIRSEAKRHGYQQMVRYGEFDQTRQNAQVEEMIARKVDALILSPCDSKTIGDTILRANRAKIPVFNVDIANLSGKGKVVAVFTSDNFEGGRQAGRLMSEALKGQGKVVIINHPNVTSVMDRVRGFRDFLRQYPKIEIIADIPAWGQRDRAMAIMEDLLLMLPDLNGVFAINDDSAMGALKAIEAAGKAGKIAIVGYDASPEVQAAIRKGKIYGDVVQYSREMGEQVVRAIADYFAGKPVRPVVSFKVGVYTGRR